MQKSFSPLRFSPFPFKSYIDRFHNPMVLTAQSKNLTEINKERGQQTLDFCRPYMVKYQDLPLDAQYQKYVDEMMKQNKKKKTGNRSHRSPGSKILLQH